MDSGQDGARPQVAEMKHLPLTGPPDRDDLERDVAVRVSLVQNVDGVTRSDPAHGMVPMKVGTSV